jgi:hypothetical protein
MQESLLLALDAYRGGPVLRDGRLDHRGDCNARTVPSHAEAVEPGERFSKREEYDQRSNIICKIDGKCFTIGRHVLPMLRVLCVRMQVIVAHSISRTVLAANLPHGLATACI